MSAAANPRLEHHCGDCHKVREVQTRYEHGARLLCDDCTARRSKLKPVEPFHQRKTSPAPPLTTSVSGSSLLQAVSSSLVPSPLCQQAQEPEVEQLLQMHADGKLQLPKVSLPELPPNATPSMRKAAAFYVRVRAVREWAGDDRPVPFACGWVGEKTGMPKRTAARALRQLTDVGTLRLVGAMPGRGARGTHLYEPGEAS